MFLYHSCNEGLSQTEEHEGKCDIATLLHFFIKISIIVQRNKEFRNPVLPVIMSDPTKKYPVPDILDGYITKGVVLL